jgi:exodeoxyribonuclease V beta subunit
VSDRLAVLEPRQAGDDAVPAHRYAFGREVVGEVTRRKRERRLLDYDDLLVLLRDALIHPQLGAAAAQRVRAPYKVVLVDEFQDTDPVQWQILHAAFHGHRTLVLIGDPKQAVYAFRGGDVVTYLTAGADADTVATLDRNWRSDAVLLSALEHLLRGCALGDERIVVHPVQSAHPTPRLDGGAPLRIRQVHRSAFGLRGTRNPRVDEVRGLIAGDVAADIVATLRTARLDGEQGPRPIRPGDIAVLTRRNTEAMRVQQALTDSGVPAVVSGLTSVFGTDAARDWLRLLDALEHPGHAGRTASLSLTDFVGWDAHRLAAADEGQCDQLADTVRSWARVLAERGVGALLEAAAAGGLAERLAARGDAGRTLTDLRHIGQVLQQVSAGERLGVAALGSWLRHRIADAEKDYAEERSRRLETDQAAVQVLTVHASKGLEFPVVYVPFAWDRFEPDEPTVLRFHDGAGQRILHLGGARSPHYQAARNRHLTEERGEDLRLLYVALTRARCQVVTWWSPSSISAGGPLSRVLFGDHLPNEQPPAQVKLGPDEDLTTRLARLATASGGAIAVEPVTGAAEPAHWSPPARPAPHLELAAWARGVDLSWRRLSYSALTAGEHESRLVSEPEATGIADEPDAGGAVLDGPDPGAPVCPLGPLPGGAAFGTLVHEVLERVDPTAADLGEQLRRHSREQGAGQILGGSPERLDALVEGLEAALATPMGPFADGLALRAVPPRDRLCELEFELPLAGGDHPVGNGGAGWAGGRGEAATVPDIADLLRRHVTAQDPLAAYPDALLRLGADSAGGVGRLRGYLTGSIDAVLRLGPPDSPRYLVVDYKTNRLAPPEEELTTWHYRPQALIEAMIESHYPLQLMLYLVALHRFLRWRQVGYDPQRHLGGGLYLFLRGMVGPGTPQGVFGWRPPAQLVVELSALLDHGALPEPLTTPPVARGGRR